MNYPPVYNSASVTMLARPDVTVTASTDPSSFGAAAYPAISGAYMSSSTEALALAERIVNMTNVAVFCPTQLELKPRRDDQLDAALQRELRDRVTVKTASPSVAYELQVESIGHTIDVLSGEWTTTLGFSSRSQVTANVNNGLDFFVLDDAISGALNGFVRLGW